MDRFVICQAFAQLEADYNVGGWLRERPSNQRRMEAISVQLHRMRFDAKGTWVDIEAVAGDDEDDFDHAVRDCYMRHVLLWNLPTDEGLDAAMRRMFDAEFLAQHAQFATVH